MSELSEDDFELLPDLTTPERHRGEVSVPFPARRQKMSSRRRKNTSDVSLRPQRLPRGGCVNVPNDVLSCSPTPNQIILQNSWFIFEWSTLNPWFNQVNNVNIYLFSASTGQTIGTWNRDKLEGTLYVQANDSFWGSTGPSLRPGHNRTYSYYFVLLPSTATVHRGETSLPIFSATQTALPNSILSSMSVASVSSVFGLSAASVASTASLASITASSIIASISSASISSESLASIASSSSGSRPSNTGLGGLQNGDSGGGFPHWAIALITVLGFLLLCAIILGWYLVMRRIRKQRETERRDSMGSSNPMVGEANIERAGPTGVPRGDVGENAALLGTGAIAGAGGLGLGVSERADRESLMSGSDTTNSAVLSGADAAIVADAFRQAMRNPDLSQQPVEEDETPSGTPGEERRAGQLISDELAREGTDIRSVGSARGVQVQGSSFGS